jgi:hypothetical protein
VTVPNAFDAQLDAAAAETASAAVIVSNHMDAIALLINGEVALGNTFATYQIMENGPRATVVQNLQDLGYVVWSAPTPFYPSPVPAPGQNPFTYPFPAFYVGPGPNWTLIWISWST